MERFESLNNYTNGIRLDINEKFIPPKYFVDMDRYNFDSIVGCDKIKERLVYFPYELVAGKTIDGIYEYIYRDTSQNQVTENIVVCGGSIFSVKNPISLTATGVGFTNVIAGTYGFTSTDEVGRQVASSWEYDGDIENGDQITVNNNGNITIYDRVLGAWVLTLSNPIPIVTTQPINIVLTTTTVPRNVSFDWTPAINLYSGLSDGRVDFAIHQDKLYITNGLDYPVVFWGQNQTVFQMGAPSVSDSGNAGALNGTYYYAVTFETDEGEDYIGTVSNLLTVVNKKVTVNLPIGYAGTNRRIIYRTTASGTVLYRVAIIENNTELTYEDNISDVELLQGASIYNDLTSIWKFNETTGRTAVDEEGVNPLVTDPLYPDPQWVAGKLGNCAKIEYSTASFVDDFEDGVINPFWDDITLAESGGALHATNGHAYGTPLAGPMTYVTYTHVHTADQPTDTNWLEFRLYIGAQSVHMRHYAHQTSGGTKVRNTQVWVDGVQVYSIPTSDNIYYKMEYIDTKTVKCYYSYNNITWTLIYTATWVTDFIPNRVGYEIYSNAPDQSYAYWFSMLGLPGSPSSSFRTSVSDDFAIDLNGDFSFYGWVKMNQVGSGLNIGIGEMGASANSAFLYLTESPPNPNLVNLGIIGTAGNMGIFVGGTWAEASDPFPVDQWTYCWAYRRNGQVHMGWNSDGTPWANEKVTFSNSSPIQMGGTYRQFHVDTVFGANGISTFYIDQWEYGKNFAVSNINLETFFNSGAGTESYFGGAVQIPSINNECPKPRFLQVQYSRLAGCGTDKLSNQLFVTDTYGEVWDIANAVDVGGQSNDNTALTGLSQDYVNTVVFSQKNIFMVDMSTDPVTSKITRANIGCLNGYTVKKLPQYRDFEGGVIFLSELKDFRVFNSNFSQPLITVALSENVTDENWSRAISPILDYYIDSIKGAEFYDYKYHISFGNIIMVLDIRNQGWTKYSDQNANCFGLLGTSLYCGRVNEGIADQMYASDKLWGTEQFNAVLESGAILSSEKENYFEDLYFYFTNTGYNKLKLEVILEDDYDHPIKQDIYLRQDSGNYYDTQYYQPSYYLTLSIKDGYFVYHLNRWARWLKWKLISTDGKFQYRGSKAVGQQTGERQNEK